MPKIRSIPNGQGYPALTGRLIVDTFRGQVRVRSWPRKRGKKLHPKVKEQNDIFRENVRLTKICDPSMIKIATEATKGTGLYPRDLLMHAMTVGLCDIVNPDGTVITHRQQEVHPVMFQGCILNLDAPMAIGANVEVTIPWPLPILDTAAFWSPATPQRITIPPGVEVVTLDAQLRHQAASAGVTYCWIENHLGERVALTNASGAVGTGELCSTGPIVVQPGDWFVARTFCTRANTLQPGPASHFSIQILQGS